MGVIPEMGVIVFTLHRKLGHRERKAGNDWYSKYREGISALSRSGRRSMLSREGLMDSGNRNWTSTLINSDDVARISALWANFWH